MSDVDELAEGESIPDSDEEMFEVEKIISRRLRNNRWEYLIKWRGYGDSVNSWEPASHLFGCEEAIRQYVDGLKYENPAPRSGTSRKRQSRKTKSSKPEPNSTVELEEKDPSDSRMHHSYKIVHLTSQSPISPSAEEKKQKQFSEYKESKGEKEEKSPKDQNLEKKKSFKILATIVFFLLVIFALVQPVGFRQPITHSS